MADEQKRATPRRPRSVVWCYFDKIPNEPLNARCKVCQKVCHHAMNTSNLLKHLKLKHPDTFKQAEEQRDTEMDLYLQLKAKSGKPLDKIRMPKRLGSSISPKNQGSSGMTGIVKVEGQRLIKSENTSSLGRGRPRGSSSYTKVRQNLYKALMSMLAKDMIHPSLVTGRGFREFLAACDVRMEVPSKKSIYKTLMPELLEETKLRTKLEVKTVSSMSMSVESWLYKGSQSFVTISIHFIKDNWCMSNFVLDTFDCTDERTETNMATNLKRLSDEYGVTERIMALVSDAPDETLSSASLVNGWEQLTGFGYTLNTVVIDALASVPEISRIQKKSNEAVAYFDLSVKASETLSAVQQQHNLPMHRLKQERVRDWISIYHMFNRIIEQYEAVNTVLCFLSKDHMCLCDDEVEVIRGVVQVLKPFHAATQELCSEPYTCVSKIIPITNLLQQVISASMTSTNIGSGPQAALKNALLSQMQQHFSGLENKGILSAATLLDPRYKQHAFTDPAALEAAKQRLISDTQSVVQNNASGSKSTIAKMDSSATFWGMFDKKVVDAGAMKTDVTEADNETRRFFKEVNIPRTADPLHWWKLNEIQFPHLKIIAKKYLCVPATAIPSNRLFTKDGIEFSRRRELFKPGQLNGMIFLNQNLL
ncbi:zinc finger BED domain-containing protein 4 [Elysia marginata]|uniref:Zinc finger BED domain-containing protein 4 n=1 Tax=Elysia marginata TaxID=1093978 RepID=A0AAV4HHX9_9GAST|nr:zinc finger BED domain-containing protein 4 [Elysia marginata]